MLGYIGSMQLWIPRLDALDGSNSSSKPMNVDVFEVSTVVTSKPHGKVRQLHRLFNSSAHDNQG